MTDRIQNSNQYIYPYMGEDIELKIGPKGEVANATLVDRGKDFENKIYRVTDRVYHMVGPGLSNSTMIEGDKGIIIVDTGTTVEEGAFIKQKFQNVIDKPVTALLYTHNHYAKGSAGIISADNESNVEIWGHERIHFNTMKGRSELHQAFIRRLYIQFGYFLPESGPDALTNMGVGTKYNFNPGKVGYIRPNNTFSEPHEELIDGIRVHFTPAFSDTDDTATIWLPDEGVAINNLMWGVFPNIGAIRGEFYRDPTRWIKSLDDLRSLEPTYLLNCHGDPILNQSDSTEVLTDYRDAMQFVYDQTVRGINNGKDPSELVESIKLPDHLANSPYIQEFYGEIQYAIRGIYSGLIGWFGHDATELHPVSKKFEAKRIVEGFGGKKKMVEAIEKAYDNKEYAWVAQLCSYILKIEPNHNRVSIIKAEALRQMGRVSVSAITRNYYITQALTLEGKADPFNKEMKAINANQVLNAPPETWINNLRFYLIPEKSIDTDSVIGIQFTDIEKDYALHIRRGILENINNACEKTVLIQLTIKVWARILSNEQSIQDAIHQGNVKVTGNEADVISFFEMFELT